MTRTLRIFISVAEHSADVHGAALLRAAAERLPATAFHGLCGPRMRAAGAAALADLTAHSAMLSHIGGVLGRALRAVRLVERSWDADPPDVVVLLDSPELHLGIPELGVPGLAPRARQRGLPVLYYIAPQTWAARAWRNSRLRGCVDQLACILPFEQAYFRARGIATEFVGHPLFESLAQQSPNAQVVAALRDPSRPTIALLPGSRRSVIDAMLPLQLDVVRRLAARGVQPTVAISCVSWERRAQIQAHVERAALPLDAARVCVLVADNASLLSAADLVLVASGTATLEVAHYRKPMIVMYDAGRLLVTLERTIGRRFIRTPHLSLVNLLANARVVPEFMPAAPDPDAVARVASQLLHDLTWRRLMIDQIDGLVRPLAATRASTHVCELIAKLAQAHRVGTHPA
ncbi:MAG: lipid-A-disaccharide synthase [Phycisphaerae bacterium]